MAKKGKMFRRIVDSFYIKLSYFPCGGVFPRSFWERS